jgi:hypothetical protein
MAKLTPPARHAAREWGRARAYELINEMRDLAHDFAAEHDADPTVYVIAALRQAAQTLDFARPKQGT